MELEADHAQGQGQAVAELFDSIFTSPESRHKPQNP